MSKRKDGLALRLLYASGSARTLRTSLEVVRLTHSALDSLHSHTKAHRGSPSWIGGLLSLAAALIVITASPMASAGSFTMAGELGVDVVTSDTQGEDVDTAGVSMAARLGYMLGGPILRITPEAKFGFESPGANAFSIRGGARVNFLEGISPAVFAHVGGLVGDMEGLIWDVGIGLDLVVLPHFDVGIFGAYNQVGNGTFHFTSASYQSSNWDWLQFGAQAAVHF